MHLSIKRALACRSRCVYGNCDKKEDVHPVSRTIRCHVLKKYRIFIPKSARTCLQHNSPDVWNGIDTNINHYTCEQIEDLLELLLNDSQSNIKTNEIIIRNDNMREMTGLEEVEFNRLYSMLPSLIQHFKGREKSAKSALKVYLVRLRTGLTYEQIAHSFGISKVTLRKRLEAARHALLNDAVEQYFGIGNISRDDLVNNNTTMARTLYCGDDHQKAITIWDGTYVYCNKSFNHYLQRTTYSGQKLRNLLKPMVCVTSNGYYVDVFGPYVGKKNDASIMEHVLGNYRDVIAEKLLPGDVFLLDRGFRDCEEHLKSLGYQVKMPEFIQKVDKCSQLTTEQANRSRLVTANRFTIESRNGNMKTIWKVFDTRWSAYDQRHLMDDYRIGAMLINFFYNKIIPNQNDAPEIATTMLKRVDVPCKLSKIVYSYQFQRHLKDFQIGNEGTLIFPKLSLEELKKISLGNYQIKQMKHYVVEHLRSSSDQFQFFVCPESTMELLGTIITEENIIDPILVLSVLKSRFQSNKKSRTFVLADKSKDGIAGIIAYCCECRHGLRTVGCCSHIMCVVGYLGHLRHNRGEIKETSQFLFGKFIE